MVERYIPENEHLWIEDEVLRAWIDALIAIDHRGDKKPLIDLLRANTEMNKSAAWHLADFLARHNLTKLQNRGGKRTPSYDYPPALSKLIRAQKYYERYVARGESRDKAVERAASMCGVEEEALHKLIAGKYASARRVQKRRPPNSRP
jgi:hypothetical protein